jgi:hypothetical protein
MKYKPSPLIVLVGCAIYVVVRIALGHYPFSLINWSLFLLMLISIEFLLGTNERRKKNGRNISYR